jgi:hypothetical protein
MASASGASKTENCIETLISHELTAMDEINPINFLHKTNHYRDTFPEITFYYSTILQINQNENHNSDENETGIH